MSTNMRKDEESMVHTDTREFLSSTEENEIMTRVETVEETGGLKSSLAARLAQTARFPSLRLNERPWL